MGAGGRGVGGGGGGLYVKSSIQLSIEPYSIFCISLSLEFVLQKLIFEFMMILYCHYDLSDSDLDLAEVT